MPDGRILAIRICCALVMTLAASHAAGQIASVDAGGKNRPWEIVDNSFLIEEAFNQERGIFQNIFTWTLQRAGEWEGSFTQEWPVPGKKHQLSYTIPFSGGNAADGIGNLLVNYRYQLLDEGPGRPAMAPRVSAIVPSGDADSGGGNNPFGLQVNVPASKQFGDLYVHANAGATWLPRVESAVSGSRMSLVSPHVGGSVIWRITPMLNAMFESVAEFEQSLDANGRIIRERTVTASPGVRGGWNIGQHQLIVGAAVPVSRTNGESRVALLTYFSYELPFREQD